MYLTARGWGLAPSEFWAMTLAEFMVEADARAPFDPSRDYAGSLTQADVDFLKEMD